MYNRIFNADYLLFKTGCAIETVAFLEIALAFFERANLPATEAYLQGERKFKFEDIVNEVFNKDSNNRFSSIKFPESYKNDPELIENLEERFSNERFGVRGKTYQELVEINSKSSHTNIQTTKKLFDILVDGITLVLSSPPYYFRCYNKNIDGDSYFIVGSWKKPESWGKI